METTALLLQQALQGQPLNPKQRARLHQALRQNRVKSQAVAPEVARNNLYRRKPATSQSVSMGRGRLPVPPQVRGQRLNAALAATPVDLAAGERASLVSTGRQQTAS